MDCFLYWTMIIGSLIGVYLVYAYVQSVLIIKLIRSPDQPKSILILLAPVFTVAVVFYTLLGLLYALKYDRAVRRKRKLKEKSGG